MSGPDARLPAGPGARRGAARAGGAPAGAETLSGQWCGWAVQTGPGDNRTEWSAILILKGPTGSMEYPSLACGGTLTFESTNGSVHLYRERIDYGRDRCLDGGLV